MLKVLAGAQVFPRPAKGNPAEELWQTLAEAATQAACGWWSNGGNCYEIVQKAIKAAGRDYRGRGNGAVDVTWRGPYDTDSRRFLSHPEQWTHKAAVALAHAVGSAEATMEAPHTLEADERDQRDAERDALAEFTRGRALEQQAEAAGAKGDANIFTGAGMLEAGAERTSHDGGHADDERLNPRDDGEAGYGVDGATCGVADRLGHTVGLLDCAANGAGVRVGR